MGMKLKQNHAFRGSHRLRREEAREERGGCLHLTGRDPGRPSEGGTWTEEGRRGARSSQKQCQWYWREEVLTFYLSSLTNIVINVPRVPE